MILAASITTSSALAISPSSASCDNSLSAENAKDDDGKAIGVPVSNIPFLSASSALALDQHLMSPLGLGHSLPLLMDRAGRAVAAAIRQHYPLKNSPKNSPTRVIVLAGPGNNGGDGLVAARYLKQWGYLVDVVYPKKPRNSHSDYSHFETLSNQCSSLSINFLDRRTIDKEKLESYDVIVDSIFGFGFKPSSGIREPFQSLITSLASVRDNEKIVSVDVPSGWDVDLGDASKSFTPGVLVSLTAPKPCSKAHVGAHYLGGDFLTEELEREYGLEGIRELFQGGEELVRIDDVLDGFSVVWCTVPSLSVAESLASTLVGTSLAACVNIVPGLTSVYKWKGRIEKDQELLLMIKTRSSLVQKLTRAIAENHPYDTPEIIEAKIEGGSEAYLDWLRGATQRM